MIGTDLNLELPSISESMAENTERIATALSSIEDVLAQPVSPGSMLINDTIEMNGNAITDLSSLTFTDGNSTQIAGSMFYYQGDWYLVDTVGMIQITDAGQLNAASVGGIQGDYGGVNPAAVTYEDSSGQYIFTEDTGVYADLRADDLILQGAAGSLQIGLEATFAGDRNFLVKELPTSGKSLLVFDAATETLEDNAVTRATNGVLVTTLDASGAIEAASVAVDTDRVLVIHAGLAQSRGASTYPGSTPGAWSLSGTLGVEYPLSLPVGAVIKEAKVYASRSSTGSLTLEVLKAGVALGSNTHNTAGPISFQLNVTGLSHTVVDDGSSYCLRVTSDGSSAQFCAHATLTLQGKI